MRERWFVIGAAVIVCFAIAGVYLLVANKTYTVTAVVMADRTPSAKTDDRSIDAYLQSQKSLILSPQIGGSQPLEVHTDTAAGTISISLESPHPSTAAVALRGVVDAYMKEAGGQTSIVARLGELSAQREKLAADRNAKETALAEYRKLANVTGPAVDLAASARADQLKKAIDAAQKDADDAKAAAASALNLPNDPKQLGALFDAARAKGGLAALDQDRTQSSNQLATLQAQLAKDKLSLGPQHPRVIDAQQKIALLQAHIDGLAKQYPQAYRAFCAQQLTATQNKLTELQALVDQHASTTRQTAGDTQKLAQLESDAKKAGDALADVDKQIRDATQSVNRDIEMKLVQAPKVPDRPSSPNIVAVLLMAGCAGLALGIALAAIGGRRT